MRMMEEFQKVAVVSDILPGTIKIFRFMGHEISIANVEDKFYVFPNKCTHQGGPVGRGKLEGLLFSAHGTVLGLTSGLRRLSALRPRLH
jgi:nitrite reductase (NADH) small subunit